MEIKLASKRYLIEGKDETGLIPEGVEAVIIGYNQEGKPSILYHAELKENYLLPASRLVKQSKLIEELNSHVPTTQEGIKEIVGLLRKLSKEE